MLEKHILEARAKALAFEEREFEKRKKLIENPDAFGVPPGISIFNDALLKILSSYLFNYNSFLIHS